MEQLLRGKLPDLRKARISEVVADADIKLL